jgi:heme exporter protein C
MLRLSGAVLASMLAVTAWLVIQAPIDSMQGTIQKVLYVHVPTAFAAYAGFFVTAFGGGLYLWKRDEAWDRLALAGAEVGVVFCTLCLVSGPIWAKGTWGQWWAWDPRLAVTLLLWFIYLAYLLLRAFTEGSERTARFSAVYGLVGAAAIPLNYYAIELFGGAAMHPDNLERDSLGQGMGIPFLMSILTALVAVWHLVVVRLEVEDLQVRLASRLGRAPGS